MTAFWAHFKSVSDRLRDELQVAAEGIVDTAVSNILSGKSPAGLRQKRPRVKQQRAKIRRVGHAISLVDRHRRLVDKSAWQIRQVPKGVEIDPPEDRIKALASAKRRKYQVRLITQKQGRAVLVEAMKRARGGIVQHTIDTTLGR